MAAPAPRIVNPDPAYRAHGCTVSKIRSKHNCFAKKTGDHHVFGTEIKIARRTDLREPAFSQESNLIGEGERFALVMGDEKRGDASLAEETRNRVARADPQAGVQRGKRLVQQHQFGFSG